MATEDFDIEQAPQQESPFTQDEIKRMLSLSGRLTGKQNISYHERLNQWTEERIGDYVQKAMERSFHRQRNLVRIEEQLAKSNALLDGALEKCDLPELRSAKALTEQAIEQTKQTNGLDMAEITRVFEQLPSCQNRRMLSSVMLENIQSCLMSNTGRWRKSNRRNRQRQRADRYWSCNACRHSSRNTRVCSANPRNGGQ